MPKRVIALTNQNGRLALIVSDGEQITVEETKQEAYDP
jgi:hypothetical protein